MAWARDQHGSGYGQWCACAGRCPKPNTLADAIDYAFTHEHADQYAGAQRNSFADADAEADGYAYFHAYLYALTDSYEYPEASHGNASPGHGDALANCSASGPADA